MNSFDSKAQQWDTPDKLKRSKILADMMRSRLSLDQSTTVMEFGAGTGAAGLELVGEVATVAFVDSSSGMLDVLREKLRANGVSNATEHLVDISDSQTLEGVGHFDLIFSVLTIHHVADVEALIGRMAGLINPQGHLFLFDLVTEDGSFHGAGFDGHNGFDPQVIAGMMQRAGLINVETEVVMSIKKDNGSYPLFMALGQKP